MSQVSLSNTSGAPARPSPVGSPLTAPYWEAAARGQLLLQQCADCGKVRHYPRLLCDGCFSDQTRWMPASGRGRVHSWTHCHHAFHPAFAPELPYTLVTIDLEEGVRALGRWRGGGLAIGDAVEGHFEQRAEGPELYFTPAA
ncbi:MAG: zinc ribbon domain-containing protein [Ramlibacter sp.]|uniref:Zn-ribbon domain-containing OB-fold protein n=1 Tax=Ramlibacter sp. TaxID=1917967 RepID=UPI00261BA638|nr:OB-fold domain-containing protein [Ramlibacter sp.]MDH4377374.1 zinc ribbon domain-containing protein [Ramlibacter sp.]